MEENGAEDQVVDDDQEEDHEPATGEPPPQEPVTSEPPQEPEVEEEVQLIEDLIHVPDESPPSPDDVLELLEEIVNLDENSSDVAIMDSPDSSIHEEDLIDQAVSLLDILNDDEDLSDLDPMGDPEYIPFAFRTAPQPNYSRSGRRIVPRVDLDLGDNGYLVPTRRPVPAPRRRSSQGGGRGGRRRQGTSTNSQNNTENDTTETGEGPSTLTTAPSSPPKKQNKRKGSQPKKIKAKSPLKTVKSSQMRKPRIITRSGIKFGSEIQLKKTVSRNKGFVGLGIKIHYNPEEALEGYKIGHLKVEVTGPGKTFLSENFNKTSILDSFRGLETFQLIYLQSDESDSFCECLLKLQTFNQTINEPEDNIIYKDTWFYLFDCRIARINDEILNEIDEDLLAGLSIRKQFGIDLVEYDAEGGLLKLDIVLLKSGIVGFHSIEDVHRTSANATEVYRRYIGVSPVVISNLKGEIGQQKEDLDWFYGQIKKFHTVKPLPPPETPFHHEGLNPSLREYQSLAVNWMLYKEGKFTGEFRERINFQEWFLDQIFIPIEFTNVQGDVDVLYYNRYANYFCLERPKLPEMSPGGVLADEMGLGKTVEVLSLILLHQRPKEEYFRLSIVDYRSLVEEEELEEQEKIEEKGLKRKRGSKRRRAPSPFEFSSDKVKDEPKVKREDLELIETPMGEPIPGTSASCFLPKESDFKDELMDLPEEEMSLEPSTVAQIEGNQDLTEINQIPIEIDQNLKESRPQIKAKRKGRKKKPQNQVELLENEGVPIQGQVDVISPEEYQKETERKRGGRKKKLAKMLEGHQLEEVQVSEARNEVIPEEMPPQPKGKKGRKKKGVEDEEYKPDFEELPSGDPEKPLEVTTRSKPKRESIYERIKPAYLNALQEYSCSNQSKVVQKHFGEFYNTKIQMKSYFECFCGEGLEDSDNFVTCSRCSSSQHATCVQYNRKKAEIYYCPHCTVLEPPVEVKTTIIVTPNSIVMQWLDEIQKHIKNQHLKILYYKGVSEHGYMNPSKFGEYDLVLTTYGVLSREIGYTDLPHNNSEDGRRLRNPKRFLTVPTTLPCVNWWRCVLDEGQMIEGINSSMSQMAAKLHSVNRWTVTGTPINKSVMDLYGLFSFLGISPLNLEFYWNAIVSDSFYRKDNTLLYELFGHLIWRTSKQDVLEQLGIPPQKEITHWLTFSAVESHFYQREFEKLSWKILERIAKLKVNEKTTRISTLDRRDLHSILRPFLALRQACCHPQVVRGVNVALKKDNTMTMEELLESLMKKSGFECAEDQRLIIAALNGMAGLHILKSQWEEASEKYREVLALAKKNSDKFKPDSLQLLHTHVNLAELLDGKHKGVPHTLNDDNIRAEAESIRVKYLEKYAIGVQSANRMVQERSEVVEEAMNGFKMKEVSWWNSALELLARQKQDDDLVRRIKDELITVAMKKDKRNAGSLANKFNNASGLVHVLTGELMQIQALRSNVLNSLELLKSGDPKSFVESAVCCHLRQQTNDFYQTKKGAFKCNICKYYEQFLEYERILYNFDKSSKIVRTGRNLQRHRLLGAGAEDMTEEERRVALLKEEEELIESTDHVNMNLIQRTKQGNWRDSDSERTLKTILNYSRTHLDPTDPLVQSIREDGSTHLKLFEALRKEFPFLRVLWRQVYDQVSGIDELSQATTRLRLNYEGEELPNAHPMERDPSIKSLTSGIEEKTLKIQNIHVLMAHEVDAKLFEMRADYLSGKESLGVHLGQFMFMENLKKNGYGKKGTANEEDCPVCRSELGYRWAVLPCGHSFCSDCIKHMTKINYIRLTCPMCRVGCKTSQVFFVNTSVEAEEPVPGPSNDENAPKFFKNSSRKVVGSHSSKVQGIIETLFSISETHQGEKVIIFSTWKEVLEIIARALDQNAINYVSAVSSTKKFYKNIQEFKISSDIQVLLMPIQSGSKGLNIVEATHVILVEPILNLASELQAIGRVHRIGQVKPTFVHRFYVRDTIEEKLYKILKTHDVRADEEGSLTLADLRDIVTCPPSSDDN